MDGNLKNAVLACEKKYGKGTIINLNDFKLDIPVISSGSLGLNQALRIGGLPRGRIVEIYGDTSAGKTTLATTIIKEAHKLGERCLFIDVEHTFLKQWAETIGVDIELLDIAQPSTAEEALDIVEIMVRSKAYSVIVVDSVAALVPRTEDEATMGDQQIGLQARLMGQAMRKLNTPVSESNTILIFINQTRNKVGIVFGSPIVTAGGNALKFYSSVRIELNKAGDIKDGTEKVGFYIRAKVVKNKCAPPWDVCEIPLIFNQGISQAEEILDAAINLNIIKKAGSWYSYNDIQIGQGKSQAREWLNNAENSKAFQEILQRISN